MGMRRSPLFKFRAKLLVVLILTSTVSPGMVWCHESDGSAKIAYGPCSAIPIPESSTETSSFSGCVEAGCDSCVDTPIFTIGPTEDYSHHLADLIANMASIAPYCFTHRFRYSAGNCNLICFKRNLSFYGFNQILCSSNLILSSCGPFALLQAE